MQEWSYGDDGVLCFPSSSSGQFTSEEEFGLRRSPGFQSWFPFPHWPLDFLLWNQVVGLSDSPQGSSNSPEVLRCLVTFVSGPWKVTILHIWAALNSSLMIRLIPANIIECLPCIKFHLTLTATLWQSPIISLPFYRWGQREEVSWPRSHNQEGMELASFQVALSALAAAGAWMMVVVEWNICWSSGVCHFGCGVYMAWA